MGNREKKIEKKYLIRRVVCGAIAISVIAISIDIAKVNKKVIEEKTARIKLEKENIQKKKKVQELYQGLNVVKKDFEWSEKLEEGNKPNKIVLHHSAIEDMNIDEVHEKHLENGWAGIGYHYFINKKGDIYQGREENIIGAHVKDNNINTLGICLEGNLEKNLPTQEQDESLLKVLEYLSFKYDIEELYGHRDLGETLCPGENLKVSHIKNKLELFSLEKED
ncbi:MAG: peptidoglycan recognition protein family protein [Sarcina sp.]